MDITSNSEDVKEESNKEEASKASIVPPVDIATFLTHSDFRIDWTRRRKVIYYTLAVLGVLIVAVHVVLLAHIWDSGQDGRPVDFTVGTLISTLIWSDMVLLTAIIGSYVFGASFDAVNFRKNATNIINTLNIAKKE